MPPRFLPKRLLPILLVPLVAGCSIRDANTAHKAQKNFVGMSETDLESCLGAPDQHQQFGSTEVLTYVASSSSSGGFSLTLPIIGGFNLSGGGYCHANFRIDNGLVTSLRYTGEKDTTLGSDSYCAPIVRSCVQHPYVIAPAAPAPATAPATAAAPTH